MAYSYERHNYCKTLKYDILDLTELHNVQVQNRFKEHTWVHYNTSVTTTDENDRSTDPAADSWCSNYYAFTQNRGQGARLRTRWFQDCWVKIKGPVCNIFYIVVYIPHKGRSASPVASDTRHNSTTKEIIVYRQTLRLRDPRRRLQLPTATQRRKLHRTMVYDQKISKRTWQVNNKSHAWIQPVRRRHHFQS